MWSINQVVAVGHEGVTNHVRIDCMVPLYIQSDSYLCRFGHASALCVKTLAGQSLRVWQL